MDITVLEIGTIPELETPDIQSMVVQFDGNFEEYKQVQREEVALPNENIELVSVAESYDGSLVIDYIAILMNRKPVRQIHFVPQR
jgi:hypothetical protein